MEEPVKTTDELRAEVGNAYARWMAARMRELAVELKDLSAEAAKELIDDDKRDQAARLLQATHVVFELMEDVFD